MNLRPGLRKASAALACVAAVLLSQVLFAQAPVVVGVHYGFGGAVPDHEPCPLTLQIDNQGTRPVDLWITVYGPETLAGPFVHRRVTVSAGVGRLVTLLVPGYPEEGLSLQIESRERTSFEVRITGGKLIQAKNVPSVRFRLESELPWRPLRRGVLALGGRGMQVLSALDPKLLTPDRRGRESVLMIEGALDPLCVLDARLAPDTWLAYSGVETILWTDPDPAEMPDPAQVRALREWVQAGGRLVILSAQRPESFTTELLSGFWPDPPRAQATSYPCPLGVPDESWKHSGFVLEVDPVRGVRRVTPTADSWLSDIPLLRAERNLGEGKVVLAGFDPFIYDLSNAALFNLALNGVSGIGGRFVDHSSRSPDQESNGPFGGAVFQDLLLNENVLRPSLGLFVLLGVAFVVLIGPVDYKLLKRLGKLHWSPVTLIVYTALFAGTCIGATYFIFAPDEEVNRVAMLHLTETPSGEDWVHGWLYHGIYAPIGGAFQPHTEGFDAFGAAVVQGVFVDDFGNPRTGSMHSEPQNFLGAGRQPVGVELGFNSFREIATRIAGRPDGTIEITVQKSSEPGFEFDVTVHNGLGAPLEGAVVLDVSTAVRLGDIPAGGDATGRLRRGGAPSLGEMAASTGGPGQPFRASRHWGRLTPEDGIPVPLRRFIEASAVRGLVNPETLRGAGRSDRDFPGEISGHLRAGRAALMGWTRSLPFRDPAAGDSRGFTYVHLRKVFDLGPRKR